MIRLIDAHKKFGNQTIYDGIDASITRGERIGLLGKNGAGKSTLFKVLMGRESLDSGELLRDRKCSIGYLSQEIHPLREGTVFENMLNHLGPWTEADLRLKAVMKGLEAGDPQALDGYDDAMEAFVSAGGYEMEARAKAILLGLGFSVAQLDAPVATLSGGWAMRLALGGLLAFEHDILLLDEPTNHLDLLSVKWFEDFLRSYAGAILITCHDRDFLDRVITKTFELELGKLHSYTGNYSAYLPQKDHRLAVHQASFDTQQKKTPSDAGLRRSQPRQRSDRLAGPEPAQGDGQGRADRCASDRQLLRPNPSARAASERSDRRQVRRRLLRLWRQGRSIAISAWRSSEATRWCWSGPTAPARRRS